MQHQDQLFPELGVLAAAQGLVGGLLLQVTLVIALVGLEELAGPAAQFVHPLRQCGARVARPGKVDALVVQFDGLHELHGLLGARQVLLQALHERLAGHFALPVGEDAAPAVVALRLDLGQLIGPHVLGDDRAVGQVCEAVDPDQLAALLPDGPVGLVPSGPLVHEVELEVVARPHLMHLEGPHRTAVGGELHQAHVGGLHLCALLPLLAAVRGLDLDVARDHVAEPQDRVQAQAGAGDAQKHTVDAGRGALLQRRGIVYGRQEEGGLLHEADLGSEHLHAPIARRIESVKRAGCYLWDLCHLSGRRRSLGLLWLL